MLFSFGDCVLDLRQRELKRGNSRVAVEPLTLDLLEFLIRARDRVVSRDELVEHVWIGRIISDATISSRMSAVRQAIGDINQKQDLIRTYSRRGYRFVGTVEVIGAEYSASCVDPSGQGAPASFRSSDRRRPVICVLGFATPSPELDALAMGVVEDITTELSRLGWFSVLARSVSLLADGWAADVRQLGPGVDYAVEGSLRQVDGCIRVTVRLLSVADATAIWSSRYDVSKVQRKALAYEIPGTIVSAIVTRLERTEISAAKKRPKEREEALRRFLLGTEQVYLWSKPGLDNALQLFQESVEIDPEFAPAYGMAAYCFVQRKSNGWISDREKEEAECARFALRAAELAPDNASVLCRAAHAIASVNAERETGEAMIERALQLCPGLGTALYVSGWVNLFGGQPARAATNLKRALEISSADPLAFKVRAAMSYAYLFLGRYDEGAAIADRVCRARPAYQTGLRAAAANCAMAGRSAEARMLLARSLSLDPNQKLSTLPNLIPFKAQEQMDRWVTALSRAGMPK